MDSRDLKPPQIPSHHHHYHHHLQSNTMLGHNSAAHHSLAMISPNMSGFPFNSAAPPLQQSKPPSSDGVFDGSPPSCVDSGKKKRGRPRKYAPDGNIALGLSATPISSSANSFGHADSGGGGSDPPVKRNRGRPPGSGKKQLDALGGYGGVGFTPHVITVNAGEDIVSKIMEFSRQGPRTICILSGNGAIYNVTLRQPATSGGVVTFEGRFEIIYLSGSILVSDDNGGQNRIGGLSVLLAGSDGRVLGGGVAGPLLAASPVHVILGSFIADEKKSTKVEPLLGPTSQMLNFGAPLTSSPPQGASSESSGENGNSPLNRDPGIYTNTSQALDVPAMNMYQLWSQNQH